ncbi:NADPH:quinone reductase [Sphingobium sp. AP50]|uniref:NADH oxidase n=1 Tax=Sphingobium sp. AP50 TaxID=1884369 RepID=UPI0008BE4DF3|nr:NADH oxidase [Sphingobium sp. AP50]SEJ65819.1 NADPH:quinone reductase [Sphingobium sp. AP50]
MTDTFDGFQLQSTIDVSGTLRLELVELTVSDPAPDEVIVRVEASPINPSDLAVMLGAATAPADLDTLNLTGSQDRPIVLAKVSPESMGALSARIGIGITPGAEGAGLVVAAGRNARHFLGRRVSMRGGGMYAQYRKLRMFDCVALPDDLDVSSGAAMFINPLTALGFVETMRTEGFSGLVHLAAASNLGQMLNRLCIADDIPLINVVRSTEQARLLLDQGARYVLDSLSPDYESELREALYETGITLAFDPIGGGSQASQVLAAMEAAATRDVSTYNRYGSEVFKQLYIYGLLNPSPTVLDRWVGFAWSIGGWLLTHRLQRFGKDGEARMLERVRNELTTTFASHYTARLGLRDVLNPDIIRAYSRKATGEKFLVTPQD